MSKSARPIDVLLVTTWNTACGISEHSAMLKVAVEAADPMIRIIPSGGDYLDPKAVLAREDWIKPPDTIVHLNYHAALHSQWTPDPIHLLQENNCKVLVTYHDTGVPNSDQCLAITEAVDAYVVHEPASDLLDRDLTALPAKFHYWRMGVPGWALPYQYSVSEGDPGAQGRPILGTVGFPSAWKNYTELARITGEAGWGLVLLAPGATADQIAEWRGLNPYLQVEPTFLPRGMVVSMLAGCDATCFAYVTHNTGQSGAILQGIAARKPVIALRTCRQFRALAEDPRGSDAIFWAEDFNEIRRYLTSMPISSRPDPATVALAEQESWAKLGRRYAGLYRELAGRPVARRR